MNLENITPDNGFNADPLERRNDAFAIYYPGAKRCGPKGIKGWDSHGTALTGKDQGASGMWAARRAQ